MWLHDLLYIAASLLLASDEHPKVVRELPGHSSISITMDLYSHMAQTLQRRAASKIQGILTG